MRHNSSPKRLKPVVADNPRKPGSILSSADKYKAPALEKGLDIIELLADYDKGLSQGEIANALNRTSNEIYRMLTTLIRRGYISKAIEVDRYTLSLKLFSLSHRYPPISRLINFATPLMKKVTREVWQSCHIVMENNGDIVVVASVDSPGYWDLGMRVGSVIGLSNTSSGRVLAAFSSSADRKAIISRHKLVVGEPKIDLEAFYRDLDSIEKTGYDLRQSNTVMGVTNMSFPIFDQNRVAVAAVTCPYIKRIDTLDISTIDQCKLIYGRLAQKLTHYYWGKGRSDEN